MTEKATRIVYDCATHTQTEEEFDFVGTALEELKANKKQEINNAFEVQINNGTDVGYLTLGLPVNVHVYDSKTDLSNYQLALTSMMAQNMESRYIKVKEENPFISVTVLELQAIVYELALFGDNLWVRKQQLYNEVDAAQTAEEVAQIIW